MTTNSTSGTNVATDANPLLNSMNNQNTDATENIAANWCFTVPGKFRLPKFDYANPEVWFAAADIIFSNHSVLSESAKFSALLEHLDSTGLIHLHSITSNPGELTPYAKAKQILLNLYATSAEKKFEQLLNGTRIDVNAKPSLILQEVQRLADGIVSGDDFIKKMWLQKLPTSIRAHLATHNHLALLELVKTADTVHNIFTMKSTAGTPAQGQTSVAALQQSSPNEIMLKNLCAAVAALTSEVSALKFESHRRSRSPNRPNTFNRRRGSPVPYRYNRSRSRQAYVKNNLCTYHYRFGDKAIKCLEGCRHYKKSTSEN